MHFICRAIDESNGAVLDSIANEVITNIDVLGAGVELTEFCMNKCQCILVIVVDSEGTGK
jgi:hypothetical protein